MEHQWNDSDGEKPKYLEIYMEFQWNDSDGEKPKYLERKLSQCPFFHHIFTQTDLVTGWQLTTRVLV